MADLPIRAERVYVAADDDLRVVVTSRAGSESIYYGGPDVSATVNDGTLTAGNSLTLTAGKWFVSVGRGRLLTRVIPQNSIGAIDLLEQDRTTLRVDQTIDAPGFTVDGSPMGGVSQQDVDDAVDAHSADTTGVHGISNTADLETTTGAQSKADGAASTAAAALSAHAADTTTHGVDMANVPSAGQKAALAGTSGTPGAGNPYVTTEDARLSALAIPADYGRSGLLAPNAPWGGQAFAVPLTAVNNQAWWSRFWTPREYTVSTLSFAVVGAGAVSGTISMVICDEFGTILDTVSATAGGLNGIGVKTFSLDVGSLVLPADTIFYVGLSVTFTSTAPTFQACSYNSAGGSDLFQDGYPELASAAGYHPVASNGLDLTPSASAPLIGVLE